MIIAGMDTAADRLHVVAYDTESDSRLLASKFVKSESIELTSSNPDVRRAALYYGSVEVCKLLTVLGSDVHIFCEEPISLRNGKTNRLLALAAGAIWAGHLEFDVYWHWVNISTWKKKIVGKGNATKDEVKSWSLIQGGESNWDEDMHDAWAICQYGVLAMENLDSN